MSTKTERKEESVENKSSILTEKIRECSLQLPYLDSLLENQEEFLEETTVRIENTFCTWENELLTEVDEMHGAQTFLHGDILFDFKELSKERVEFLNVTLNSFFLEEEDNTSSLVTQAEKRKLLENTIHEKHDLLIKQAEKIKQDIDNFIEADKLLWEKVIKTKDTYFAEAESILRPEYKKLEMEVEKLEKESKYYTLELSVKLQRLASLGRRLSRLQKNKEDSDTQLTRIMELRRLLKDIGELEE